MHHLKFGKLAEYFVIFLYKLQFYKILGHRVRNYYGEIDIIVCSRDTIIFVEVKARRYLDHDYLFSPLQAERIKKAAAYYLLKNPKFNQYHIQFDLVLIMPYKLPVIIKNAW